MIDIHILKNELVISFFELENMLKLIEEKYPENKRTIDYHVDGFRNRKVFY